MNSFLQMIPRFTLQGAAAILHPVDTELTRSISEGRNFSPHLCFGLQCHVLLICVVLLGKPGIQN